MNELADPHGRPPWPWMSEKTAAKELGVDRSLLRGIAGTGGGRVKIRVVERLGQSGESVWFYCTEDVKAARRIMAGMS